MPEILRNPTEKEIINAIELNQTKYIKDFARSPLVKLYEDSEKKWIISQFSSPFLNRVINTKFSNDDTDDKISQILNEFRSKNFPMLWDNGPSSLPNDIGSRLLSQGLLDLGAMPGMALDLQNLNDVLETQSLIEVKKVDNLKVLEQWSKVLISSFGLPDYNSEYIFKIESDLFQESSKYRKLYIGLFEGKPVATATLFLGGGAAGIYCVGTLPAARRKGFGEVMTIVLLIEAKKLGYRIATLHASKLGIGVYQKLGFQEYCKLSRYMLKNETER